VFSVNSELKKAQIMEVLAKADERINLGCGDIQII
jgi:hypothetical protein